MTETTIYNWINQEKIDRGEDRRADDGSGAWSSPRRSGVSEQLETELAVSRKVNEVFFEQGSAPKGSSR